MLKRAIVTGANGFIGTNLIKELVQNGVEVIAVDRRDATIEQWRGNNKVSCVSCDLNQTDKLPDIIKHRDIDVFYHLAWAGTSGASRADYDLQLRNSKYVCDSAVAAKKLLCKKFVCVGTITEKIAENILNIPVKAENTIYGIAKHTAHCLLEVLCKKLDISFVWARLSNIYGPGNKTGNIVSYTLAELHMGNVPAFSKALQPYDVMYVKDTVRALYLLGEKELNHTCYFIGSGQPRILKDYLEGIRDIYGHGAAIELGKRPEDGLEYQAEWFSTDALQADTGFVAAHTFEQGIRQTIDFMKTEGNSI